MDEFKNLKRVAMSELKRLDAKYANRDEFAKEDIECYDKLMHGLKSQLTSEAMMEAEEYEQEENMSGRRGRSSVTGRFVSRDGGNSYAEGYSRGYSEAMSQQREMSGHYYYPPERMRY